MPTMFLALVATVLLLCATGFFLLGTPPLLLLKYDVPNDARFMRGLFNVYFIAVTLMAALASASYALAGQPAYSVGMALVAVFALAARWLIVRRMDALLPNVTPGNPVAIRNFRRMHMAGMLLNGVQLAALGWSITGLPKSSPEAAAADARSLPPPQRAPTPRAASLPPPNRPLTGRDASGKSVFKSFDITPQVVAIDSNPGLTFYELYAT